MDIEFFKNVREEIQPFGATLIAVSKGQPFEKIETLYALGQRDFGENYSQELVEKAKYALEKGLQIRWHFIGKLQSNKIKSLIPYVFCYHSVENQKQLELIDRFSQKTADVFIQVNVDREATKGGLEPEKLRSFFENLKAYSKIKVLGLMAIPERDSERAFVEMKNLSDSLGSLTDHRLSMGMSDDYVVALQNGATHLRIGTKIFGPRMLKKPS